jgi:hypothetical protein
MAPEKRHTKTHAGNKVYKSIFELEGECGESGESGLSWQVFNVKSQ